MGYQYRGPQRGAADPWQAPPEPKPTPTPPVQKPRKPCGTPAAAMRHYRRGEKLCDPCRDAKNAYCRARARKSPRARWRHGTYPGAKWHYRRGEKPCDPCREAANKWSREHYVPREKTVRAAPMKLSSDDIRTIKDRLEAGAQQKDLAAEYGVSGPLISMIKTGKRRTT